MKRNPAIHRWRSRVCLFAFCLLSAGCETVVPTPQVTDKDWKLKFATMMAAIEFAKASGATSVEPIEISAPNEITLLKLPKHLVVILDTSGSMRRFENDAFKPAVEEVFAHLTRHQPELEEVWVLDAWGRELFGAEGRPKRVAENGSHGLVDLLRPAIDFSGSDPTIAVVRALKVLASEPGSIRDPWDIVILGDELFIQDTSLFAAVMKSEFDSDAAEPGTAALRVRLHVVQFPILGSAVEPSTGSAFSQYASLLAAKFGGQYFRIME